MSETESFLSGYDLVMVMPWSDGDEDLRKPHVIEVLRRIAEAHFKAFTYLSVQKDEVRPYHSLFMH
jgi:hypothetical protein